MKQRRFEIFIAIILAVISYFGNYYLKEKSSYIGNFTMSWNILNILWLLSMVIIGYWGLSTHEFKWVKTMWLLVNSFLLILLLSNKLAEYWHHPFLPESASNVIRTPFLFIMAAFLPRWFSLYKPPTAEK